MGYRHSRDEILAAGATVAVEDGLPALTYRAVAARLGIADRTVVYYFPTKGHLVTAVLDRVTDRLQSLLDGALGVGTAPEADVLSAAWWTLASDEAAPATRVLLELLGLAARDQEPYAGALTRLTRSWVSWLESRLEESPGSHPGRSAALVAQLDGLLVLRAAAGPEVAHAAARALGVAPTPSVTAQA